jgi:dephospho-CoA kinase
MYCIGLTGSIGSGKSTVAAQFAKLGIDIVSADHIARNLVQRDQPALQNIIQHFGTKVLTENGELDRRHLREIIAHNTLERMWLENLLHPLIRKEIEKTIQQCTSPYCIIEIPLLFDKTGYPYLNRILLVLAETELQIKRLMQRDHASRQHACAMLATTRNEEAKRLTIADDILTNDGTLDDLKKNVAHWHEIYLRNAAPRNGSSQD